MKRKSFLGIGLAAMMLTMSAVPAFAEEATPEAANEQTQEYDYENKDLWFKETDNFYWTDAKTAYEHNNMASEGFDMDAFVNSKMGEGVINNMYYFLTYADQMDPEVLSYWEGIGIKKEIHDEDDEKRVWTSYTPLSAYEEGNEDKKYPVVFCIHGNNNPLFLAETYGFAQYGAEQEYITVMPWADNDEIIVEEVQRIMEVLREEYPIDESRVYVTGFSKGGQATEEVVVACPELFAAAAPGGAPMKDYDTSAIQKAIEYQVPVLAYAGMYDMGEMYPLGKTNDSWAARWKTRGFMDWMQIAGAQGEEVTVDGSRELAESAEDIVERKLGADFTETEVLELDGTQYYKGSYLNEDGVPVYVQIGIEGAPHWPTPSIASIVWDFFEQFSRNPETGELIIEAK